MTFTKIWVAVLAMATQGGEVDGLLPTVKVANRCRLFLRVTAQCAEADLLPPPEQFKVSVNVV